MLTSTYLGKPCTTGDSFKLPYKSLKNTECEDACQSKIESTPAQKKPKKIP